MRLIKMVRVCAILNYFIIPLLISQPFAQTDNPFIAGAEEWPDIMPEITPFQEPQVPEYPQQKVVPEPIVVAEKSTSVSSTPGYSVSTSNSPLKIAGPPRILVCRPVYVPYTEETKTKYIASITEAYFHFKFNGLPGYQVIPQERVANNVQHFRNFSRRLSRSSYIDAAKQLGASYLFYVEYEPLGKKVKFNVEFYSIAENKKLLTSPQELDLEKFEDGLLNCLDEIIASLPDKFSNEVHQQLGASILGKNAKAVESFGDKIASMEAYSKKSAEAVVPDYEKIVNQNADFHLAKMVAASAMALAQNFDNAIRLQESLIISFGSTYPALFLQLAAYNRMAGKFNKAIDAANNAQRVKELELLARTEKARIYEAQGDLKAAKNEYQNVLSIGGADGEIYFQLALVSIGLNDLSASSNYISDAISAGRTIDRGDYYDLGLRYKNLGSADEKAIEAFKNSLGIQQDKEDAWLQLAEIYSKMGREIDVAECYMSLFHINNDAYKDYLAKAGFKFEALGKVDRAKDAYSLFLARRYNDPEISIRLARIEVAAGNCDKATDIIRTIDASSIYETEVKKINQQCGVPERRIIVNTDIKRQKGNAAVFMWRVVSGLVTGGGVGAGYYINTLIDKKIDKYNDSKASWIADLSNRNLKISTTKINKDRMYIESLHSDIETFKLYRLVSYGAAGVGATSFTLSVIIPIATRR